MTRRILAASRGVVVHSRFMRDEMRAAGFTGPTAVIPHGAWIPQADRNGFRHKLGLDEATPLIGIFGFLKPYKRIAESLRAFRRLVRLMPNVKMILVGEPHPEFPVESMIRSMGLSANVRVLGFAPIEDFVGYLGACDIVLNLRFPTVGESSGTLLRSLGLGKAVMVSEVGSFQEFPDDVCLKVPVGPGEEDLIFEYLNLLVSRPEVAQALGRARQGLCGPRVQLGDGGRGSTRTSWRRWLQGHEWTRRRRGSAALRAQAGSTQRAASTYHRVSARLGRQRRIRASYLNTHQTRLVKTLEITPPGRPGRPHSGDGRVSADHSRAAHQARLRRGARLLLRETGAQRSSHRDLRRRRNLRVRDRSLRRREGRVPLPRRPLLHGALRRTDRASVRRSDAPDERGQPHPEARRPPGADHAQHRRAARHLGAFCRAIIPDSSTPTSGRRKARAKWTRGTIASTRRARFTSCWRIPASKSRCSRRANSATSRIPSSAGCCTCWNATA